MEENIPLLEEAKFKFSQDSHCNSDKEYEEIEIELLGSLGLDRDEKNEYFVIKTEGWALNNAQELEELFDRIRKVLK